MNPSQILFAQHRPIIVFGFVCVFSPNVRRACRQPTKDATRARLFRPSSSSPSIFFFPSSKPGVIKNHLPINFVCLLVGLYPWMVWRQIDKSWGCPHRYFLLLLGLIRHCEWPCSESAANLDWFFLSIRSTPNSSISRIECWPSSHRIPRVTNHHHNHHRLATRKVSSSFACLAISIFVFFLSAPMMMKVSSC